MKNRSDTINLGNGMLQSIREYAARIDLDADELEIRNRWESNFNRFCANQIIKVAIKWLNDKMGENYKTFQTSRCTHTWRDTLYHDR